MDSKQIAAYTGATLAIAFGAALLWLPPPGLAGQAGTVGAAFSFVTIGLGGFGLTVALPPAIQQARREGARRALAAFPPPGKRFTESSTAATADVRKGRK